MTRPDYIIAIDPDVSKSGIATLNMADKYISGVALEFPALIEYLRSKAMKAKSENRLLVVVVECSWETRHNWHLTYKDNKGKASSKGYDVGRNHETGKKIVEMCEYYGIRVVEKLPLIKCWKGKDGKITSEELKMVTGYSVRSNQEVRDAILLAWDYAGLPLKMKTIGRK